MPLPRFRTSHAWSYRDRTSKAWERTARIRLNLSAREVREYIEAENESARASACQTLVERFIIFHLLFQPPLFLLLDTLLREFAKRAWLLSRKGRVLRIPKVRREGVRKREGRSCASLRAALLVDERNESLRLNPLVGAGPRHAKRLVVAELCWEELPARQPLDASTAG